MSHQINQPQDDVHTMHFGAKWNVAVGPNLRATGWRGGQFVHYVTPSGVNDFEVEVSDGNMCCGFLLYPSETTAPGEDWGAYTNLTSLIRRTEQGSASGANVVVMALDNGRFGFKVYETQAIGLGAVRDGGDITYVLNQTVYVSENGILCNDPPAKLAQVGIATPQIVGIVAALPTAHNGQRLYVDVRL